MHLCGVANNGYTTLQVPPLCGERWRSAAASIASGQPAAPSYTVHLVLKLRPRLLDNHVGFLWMKAMIVSA